MLLEICMQIPSVVFALSRQINKQKYAKTINLLCAGNKVFVKYQAQGEFLNPNLPNKEKTIQFIKVIEHN